jgi:uncharacterized protein (DUF2342 family)
MTDEQDTPVEESASAATDAPPADEDSSAAEPQSPGDAWKEVGTQFQALGAGLASAFRTAWTNEENKRHAKEIQAGLEAMVNELGAAIKSSTTSPEVKQVKTEAGRTFETFRVAGEKTVQEVRPTLLAALHQANEQLQKLIGRMKQNEPDGAEVPNAPEPPAAEAEAKPGSEDPPVS